MRRGFQKDKVPFKVIAAVCAVAFLWLATCTQPITSQKSADAEFKGPVTNLAAVYDGPHSRAVVTWIPGDTERVSFYTITVTIPGEPSSKTTVPGNQDTAYCYVSMVNGLYTFSIAAFRIDPFGDTLQGVQNQPIVVPIGSSLAFNVNHGAIFTAINTCSLFVADGNITDTSKQVVSMRFTQMVDHQLVNAKAGTFVSANIDDPEHLPSNAVFTTLTSGGYLQKSGKLGTGVTKVIVPLFGAADSSSALNPIGSIPRLAPSSRQLDTGFFWTLAQGAGAKIVYAELTFRNGSKDTLQYELDIQPYQMSVRIENGEGGSDKEMRDTVWLRVNAPFHFRDYLLFSKTIKFSLSVGEDTTFKDTFSYWAVTTYLNTNMYDLQTDTVNGYLETVPREGTFSSGDPASHNDRAIYEYSLDTTTPDGQMNLGSISHCARGFADLQSLLQGYDSVIAIKLTGQHNYNLFNQYAVPGSYWGQDPHRWDPVAGQLLETRTTINGTPGQNYQTFINIQKPKLPADGRKEFMIGMLFYGKYFNDRRMLMSSPEAVVRDDLVVGDIPNDALVQRFWLAYYLPTVSMINYDSPLYIGNGDTISSTFDFYIDSVNGIHSCPSSPDGGANIDSISLIISQAPPGIQYNYASYNYLYPPVGMDELLQWRHTVYPFHVEFPLVLQKDVSWKGIDPSEWPSGQYFIGIVAKDEFGNSGLCPVVFNNGTALQTNPLIVTVLTGK